jgi:hypothetical protein
MKKILVAFGSVIVGNMLAEKFILKSSEDDPSGFVPVADGFGMDDAARGAAIVGVMLLADRFLGR